jgi:hypothetical protein
VLQVNRSRLPGTFQTAKVILKLGEFDVSDARDKTEAYPVFNVFISHFQGNSSIARD